MSDSHTQIMGIWKLRAFDIEYQESGAREPYFGAAPPSGYLILTPERRMMTLIVSGEREPGQTEAQQAGLFRTMLAYSGPYRFAGDQFITNVDVSWNEAWTGTEQVRSYILQGGQLDILTAWLPHPTRPERPMVRGVISWERVP